MAGAIVEGIAAGALIAVSFCAVLFACRQGRD